MNVKTHLKPTYPETCCMQKKPPGVREIRSSESTHSVRVEQRGMEVRRSEKCCLSWHRSARAVTRVARGGQSLGKRSTRRWLRCIGLLVSVGLHFALIYKVCEGDSILLTALVTWPKLTVPFHFRSSFIHFILPPRTARLVLRLSLWHYTGVRPLLARPSCKEQG